MHGWDDPFERIEVLAETAGVALATPAMGEQLSLPRPQTGRRWWRQPRPAMASASKSNPAEVLP